MTASNKMPDQLERWAKALREDRTAKEKAALLAPLEARLNLIEDDVHANTKFLLDLILYLQKKTAKPPNEDAQLYNTLICFLTSAVERGDDERARYWSRIAFQYCDLQ